MCEDNDLYRQRLALAQKQYPEMDPHAVIAAADRQRAELLLKIPRVTGPAREVCREERPAQGFHLGLAFDNSDSPPPESDTSGTTSTVKNNSHLRLVP